MIGLLRGPVVSRSAKGEVLVEVAGVGYRITVTPATMAGFGPEGSTAAVHTHLAVREDSLTLYGFASAEERDCFESLIGAHGVGPSLALAIVSVHPPADLRRIVIDGDLDALVLVPGVGRKTAARLLIELKGRLGVADAPGTEVPGIDLSARAEVRIALAGLGYDADEVTAVVKELPSDGDTEALLKAALRLLATNR